jgi:predicted metal-dependent phosphoesterase TrpH
MSSQKIDLHVHSPASADYLGDRTDREYFALLKECKRAEVGAIALTDHNTVNGHIAIDRLSKEARLNYDLNSSAAARPNSLIN